MLDKYQLDGEDPVLLPANVSTMDTINYIVEKARMTEAEILERGAIKVNLRMTEFQNRILSMITEDTHHHEQVAPSTNSVQSLMHQLLTIQQQQAQQQQELMRVVAASLSPRPRFELVKPEVFDGSSASPQAWLGFYQYACEKNTWTSDDDKIKNLRLFLGKTAKSWYELRIMEHADDTWESWRESFLVSFGENAVDRWDRAISFKYRGGSVSEYFFEKRRLLQMADPSLPDTSIVPLVIHGMSRNLQQQIQVKGPKTVEDLLQSCKELYVAQSTTPDQATGWEPRVPQTGQLRCQPPWRLRSQTSGRYQEAGVRPINRVENYAEHEATGPQEVTKN